MDIGRPTPMPCDSLIFQYGSPVALIAGKSIAIEAWVKEVRKAAKAQIDWHFTGGIAQVVHLGDEASRQRVEVAIDTLISTLQGRLMKRCEMRDKGLYREGVTPVSEDANTFSMDPFTGKMCMEQGTIISRTEGDQEDL